MSSQRTFFRLSALLLSAGVLGLAWNQIHARGLGWRLLWLQVAGPSRSEAWTPLATDSAFAYFIQRSAEFIDIREPNAYALDRIPGAQNFPFYAYFQGAGLDRWPKPNRPLIVYDFDVQSDKAPLMVQALKARGFRSVYFLRNGFKDWLDYGFPVEPGGSYGPH